MTKKESTSGSAAGSGDKAKAGSKKSIGLRVAKYLFFGVSSIVFSFWAIHLMWQMSGSGEWELEMDKDGIEIYSMKIPGSTVVKFKGVGTYDHTYGTMVSIFNDDSFTEGDNCKEFVAECVEYEFLQPWDSKRMTNVQYWRHEMPPFADRDLVLRGSIKQDEETKAILLENTAAPNLIDRNDCCVRIEHMHNTWRYTPIESGGLEVEYVQDIDMGGLFPDFLMTFAAPEVHKMLNTTIPELISREKYQGVKLDYIEEY